MNIPETQILTFMNLLKRYVNCLPLSS